MIQKFVRESAMLRRMLCVCLVLAMVLSVIPVAVPNAAAVGANETLYFKPIGGTGDTAWYFAHFFGNGEEDVRMTEDSEGNHYCTVPNNGYTSVVIVRMNPAYNTISWDSNNGFWNKTYDLTLSEGNCYTATGWNGTYMNGEWSTIQVETNPDDEDANVTCYLAGSMNDWSQTATPMTGTDGKNASVTITLAAGTYEFKIIHEGIWYTNTGTITDATGSTGWDMYENSTNCKLQATGGEYTFSFNVETKKLVITYVSGSGGGSGDSGDSGETVGTVVDLNTGTFEPDDGKLYVSTTFYDYYTDYELSGNNLDNRKEGFDANQHYVVFSTFNDALSKYYDENDGVSSTNNGDYSDLVPIYVGHFQPSWTDFGQPYWGDLYGFRDGRAYGTSSEDQKYFMSVNNSNMNLDPTLGHVNSAAWGIVADELNEDKQLVAAGSSAVMPFFDKTFVEGSSYSDNQKLGDVYENVQFPFTKEDRNGIMYWAFDSDDTTLEMKQDTSTSKYYLDDITNKNGNYQFRNYNANPSRLDTYGFFPFNEGADKDYVTSYNYGFGARLDIPFNLTHDGMQVDVYGEKQPIIFEFSGDDDVWVFIDDKLVLDIGGSHGKVTGTINFADMVATVSSVKSSGGDHSPDDADSTEAGYQTEFDLGEDISGEHTLTMFYMERGMWESNMSIAFNFVPRSAVTADTTSFTVQKQWNMAQSAAIPASIDVQLQRRAEGTTEWEAFGENVTIEKPDVSAQSTQELWSYTWDALDKFTTETGFIEYEYRVMELGENDAVLANGATNDGMMVAYGEVYSGATGYVQLISNNQVSNNIVVVIDYGLSVDVSVVDTGNSLIGIGNTLKLPVGESSERSEDLVSTLALKHGEATVKGNKICYTLTDMLMDSAENIGFCYQLAGDTSKYYYSTLTVIPATTIYYEDDFKGNDGSSYITYESFEFTPGDTESSDSTATWSSEGTSSPGTQGEDRPGFDNDYDADNIYGYDGAYTTMDANSMGTAMKFTASKDKDTGKITYGTASFSFTGTGFDVISVTSGVTGTITVEVTYPGKDSEGNDIDIPAATKIVDTYYGYTYNKETGEWTPAGSDETDVLYQVPVMKISDLAYRTYDVIITISYNEFFDHNKSYSYDFYLDAIRIYDPANDGKDNSVIQGAYVKDNEGWPAYTELRNLIISSDTFDSLDQKDDIGGIVFIDGNSTLSSSNNSNNAVESTDPLYGKSAAIIDYANFGPNNELYLAENQAISFNLNQSGDVASVQIALKRVQGDNTNTAPNVELYNVVNSAKKNTITLTINSATDLYYDITTLNNNTVVIRNTGSQILSITNIKVTYNSDPKAAATTSEEYDETLVVQGGITVNTNSINAALYVLNNEGEEDFGEITTGAIEVKSASLSFEDEILTNLYYTISGIDATEMGLLTWASEPAEATIDNAENVYIGAQYDAEKDRYMVQTAGIAAKNLGDDIYMCVYAKTADGIIYSDVVSYSPKQYAMSRLEKSTNDALKALCVSMLNYGAAAQEYFGYKTDSLMNADLTDEQKALVAAYDASLFAGAVQADESKVGSFLKTEGFSKKSATVSFEGAFAINYYFTANAEVAGDVTFYYWTADAYANADVLTAENASATAAMAATEDGRYWADITGIAAKQLDETFYVAAVYTDANGNTCCTGVIAYTLSKYCMSNASGDIGALAQATAMYGHYAKAYFTQGD